VVAVRAPAAADAMVAGTAGAGDTSWSGAGRPPGTPAPSHRRRQGGHRLIQGLHQLVGSLPAGLAPAWSSLLVASLPSSAESSPWTSITLAWRAT
jgi:hypothetical protein